MALLLCNVFVITLCVSLPILKKAVRACFYISKQTEHESMQQYISCSHVPGTLNQYHYHFAQLPTDPPPKDYSLQISYMEPALQAVGMNHVTMPGRPEQDISTRMSILDRPHSTARHQMTFQKERGYPKDRNRTSVRT